MDYKSRFRGCVAGVRAEGRYRVFAELARRVGGWPRASWHGPGGTEREVVVWCSNDYLGLGHHASVLEGAAAAVGPTVPAQEDAQHRGTTRSMSQLEAELRPAKPAALLFTSGYVANEAAISTLARLLPGCLILSDANNHASMIPGVRAAGCEKGCSVTATSPNWSCCSRRPRRPAEARGARGRVLDGRRFGPVAEMCALAGATGR